MNGLTPAQMKMEVLRHLDPRAVFAKSAAGVTTATRADPFFSDSTIEDALTAAKEWLWGFLAEHSPRRISVARAVTATTAAGGVVRLDQPDGAIPSILRLV